MADRKPFMAGNWKMHHTHLEAIQVVQKLSYRLDKKDFEEVDIVVCPAFTALRSVQTTLEGDRIPIGLGAQDCWHENAGRVHRRGEPEHARQAARAVRDRRPLRAARDHGGDRRHRRQEAARGPRLRHAADPVCGGDARRARGRRDRRESHRSDSCCVREPSGRHRGQVRGRVRADLGHRHRPQRHA